MRAEDFNLHPFLMKDGPRGSPIECYEQLWTLLLLRITRLFISHHRQVPETGWFVH